MKQIWTIARRELASFFNSLMAYVIIILFLGFTGFFTWVWGQNDIFLRGQASLGVFFSVAYWSLFFFAPALTMKSIAEEQHSGTLELMFTKPLTHWQFIFGKFLANFLLICIALVLTVPYYITVAKIGNIDHGATITGYLGLILMSAAYLSIGIFASSLTNNQIIAFFIALIIGALFHFIFGMISGAFDGVLGNVFNYLSLTAHYQSISRGVVDSKDLIYFAAVIFLGLFSAEMVLEKRNVND